MDRWQYGHYVRHFVPTSKILVAMATTPKKYSDNGGAGRGHILLGSCLVKHVFNEVEKSWLLDWDITGRT
jgi:hypothetical protein